jgi:alanine racemase
MKLSLKQIAQVTKGTVFGDAEKILRFVIIDSRAPMIGEPDQTLFIALSTGGRDAHDYVPHAVNKGVGAVLVSNPVDADHGVVVDDTLVALQQMAAFVRSHWKMKVIGITGSNGKTIVKEWLSEVLSKRYAVTKSPKSYNSQIGVPLSILSADEHAEIAVFEAGISEPGEMKHLEDIIQPDLAVLTNFGDAHADYFPSRETHLLEKLVLFRKAGLAVTAALPPHLRKLTNETLGDEHWWWDKSNAPLTYSVNGRLHLSWSDRTWDIAKPDGPASNLFNLLTTIAVLIALGEDPENYREELQNLDSVEMRLKRRDGLNGCVLIEDYYNSDLTSLQEALKFVGQIRKPDHKVVILTDMDSGMEDPEWIDRVNSQLVDAQVDKLYGIGTELNRLQHHLAIENKAFFLTTESCINHLKVEVLKDSLVLLKGARSFRLEEVATVLSRKQHRTRLEVNLTALRNNLNLFRSKLKPTTRIMGMVKAVSYGAGSVEIATALESYGVDYLAVAYADEGVQIRAAGVRTPIMVMNAGPADTQNLIEHALEPVIYSVEQVRGYIEALPEDVALGVHLELDTGMHRLGLDSTDIPETLALLRSFKRLRVNSVFSHLAVADDNEADVFTQRQIDNLSHLSQEIQSALDYPVSKHICNTAGILRFPNAHFDMVRLGLGMYGVNPVEGEGLQLVPSLKSVVSQIRTVPSGEGVSYGLGGVADHKRQIAVVPIGYADGFDRRFSDGVGVVHINGQPAKVVGKVCMDMTMVDVTGMEVSTGDEVVVFSTETQLKELSDAIGVIPYELLSGVSTRVARDYFTE